MKIQVRDDKVIIDGYVNAVERFSKPLTNKNGKKFIERIMPSVFQRAIEKNDAIKVLLNHNYDMELANTKDGSAKLYEDNIGLRAIVEVSDATVIEKAKQNKLRGWSFGFICNKEDEEINDNGISESDENTQSEDSVKNENFSSMTASQKRELLNGAYRQTFSNGWLEDYDDYFVYGSIKEDSTLYKMPYTITDGVVSIDTSKQVKVVRGGYKEVRYEEKPEQQPKQEVEKIDFSEYENRIKKIKEETE